ncbi:MAG: NAD(P)-dependent oxidoreductase [Acidimicrobiia bacterium]|nr:NAD(P)-dependent oxidoreductase [Acidimicrobiia bacterium]
MIIVDNALRERERAGRPVKVAMIGAGFMGRGVVNQTLNSVPGMDIVAISNRNIAAAERAYVEAGVADVVKVADAAELSQVVAGGGRAITDDAFALTRAEGVDCLLDVTGDVAFGAAVTVDAIEHGTHLVTMNAELDGTVGPVLRQKADAAGVILTACDGDQPGVQMNLYRFVQGIGIEPLVCGNIKGLQDPYRNPTTQREFAEKWGQKPEMVTSFADGTKISFEQAIVANATGMTVAKRGMYGYEYDGHIDDATSLYDIEQLRELGGIVEYVVGFGIKPGPGVYVFGGHDDPKQQHYLNLYKLGEGPLYSFYTPYHLCHFEVPMSIARAVLFGDAVMQPAAGPRVEVITRAKTDLTAGTVLDGLGGYHTYGECETAAITTAEDLLPIGVAEGCTLTVDVVKDHCLTYADVELPAGRLIDQLRTEQRAAFT